MNAPDPLPSAERRRRLLGHELRSIVPLVLAVILAIAAALLLGHEAERHLQAIEAWITQLGPWGHVAFVVLLVIGTSVLIPGSLFGLAAGALFGLAWGVALMLAGNLLASSVQYLLARRLLRNPIRRALEARPVLQAIQAAVRHDELRLQLLLRLTPLNPALVSYVLGAAGVRFIGFLLATLVLTVHFTIEVYLGHAGKQLVTNGFSGAHGSAANTWLIYGAAALGLVAVALMSKAAHRAVLRAIAEASAKKAEADAQ